MLASLIVTVLSLPAPVSVGELEKNGEKYHNRLVRIEWVLKDFTAGDSWSLQVGQDLGVDVTGRGKPPGKNGDRVAITGQYRHQPNNFVPRVILGARMEVIPFDVTPEQLRGKQSPFNGRLVRVEGEVKYVDRWAKGTDTFTLHPRAPEVLWDGKPGISKGDRVRVTGVFNDNRDTFETGQIDVRKAGSVEKLEKP